MTEEDKLQYQASLKHPDVEEPIDLWFYRPVGFRVALLGRRFHWTPNQITIASIFLGMGCGLLCYPSDWRINLVAVVLLIMADVCDSADGQLARLTHQYSQLGRILDGVAGDIWFITIYVCLALRLTPEWGPWCWILAVVSGACHSQQAAMADYYRQFHLLCAKGQSGSEFTDAKEVARQYAETRFSEAPIQKVFLWFYRNYTISQERLTPQFQRFRKATANLTASNWDPAVMRQLSLPLMPIANALTFNCRAVTLFLALMLGRPWFYWVAELTIFNVLAVYMICRHEHFCRKALESL